jgi:hypothetical protein
MNNEIMNNAALKKGQSNEALLQDLQQKTFRYFTHYCNDDNGLIADSSRTDSPCSITATGMALAAYPVGVERGFLSRDEAIARTLTTLRFFHESPQSAEPDDVTGYKGFYYHFLDMQTGRRAINSELSTIDSTLLVAGMLTAAQYFDRDTEAEREIRELADALYRRMDWEWALNGGRLVRMGWRPEKGFIKAVWEGYNEALLLYVLGLGSPTHPLPAESYPAWTETYRWQRIYGYEFLYAGPLFVHQLSHVWIDFQDIQDVYMREKKIDYFQNSRRATLIQQEYAKRNPRGFKGYGELAWGITASAGPGVMVRSIDGKDRRFYAYKARGIPYGPDDGTLSPWACVASLPFAPELVINTIRYIDKEYPEISTEEGFKCSFNPTFIVDGTGWEAGGFYGLDQGPIVLMIENYFTGLIWRLMRRCPPIVTGLRRAGFMGGWLTDG